MFNIVNSTAQECPEVLFSPLYFTGVYSSHQSPPEVPVRAGYSP